MSSSEFSGMLNEMLGSRLTMDKFRLRLQLGWSIFIVFSTSTNEVKSTNFP